MYRSLMVLTLLIFVIFSSVPYSKNLQQTGVRTIENLQPQLIDVAPGLSAADTCIVRHDTGAVWMYMDWAIGDELYKSYLDPGLTCTNPYPFTVTEIHMFLVYFDAAVDTFSVDVEDADLTNPSCPLPGELLTYSTPYEVPIPEAGLWHITIPLDTPQVVNGPFFAGFFIHDVLDSATAHDIGPVVTTDDAATLCNSYNLWDVDTGWVDLGQRGFLGKLVLFASGVPGGSGGGGSNEPAPSVELISPLTNDILLGKTDLWARDTSGSSIIEYVSFQYQYGTDNFVEIGRDLDGSSPNRDGVNIAGSGDGFSIEWDPSALPEGNYTLRAVAFDSLGRTAFDERTGLFVEPTPPTPTFKYPLQGFDFCATLNLFMTSPDEDLLAIDFYRHNARADYSAGMVTLNQQLLGDANGDPNDGNSAGSAEFGDYYGAPAAAAIAVKLWYDRGYFSLMNENSVGFSLEQLAEKLAALFKTRDNLGTFDDDLLLGLRSYVADHGNQINVDYLREPDYYEIRTWVEDEQRAVIIGLSGDPGRWLAVDGFDGAKQGDGTFLLTVSQPSTGTKTNVRLRNETDFTGVISEIMLTDTWQRVELMVSLVGKGWVVDRTLLGSDADGQDGWTFAWTPTSLVEDNFYFFRAVGRDGTFSSASSVFLTYNCSTFNVPGDYNSDGDANISDFIILMDYITSSGVPPNGGAFRADTNCDNNINLTDLVYYLNFLFATTATPCY